LCKGKPASFRLFPVRSYVVIPGAASLLPTLFGLLNRICCCQETYSIPAGTLLAADFDSTRRSDRRFLANAAVLHGEAPGGLSPGLSSSGRGTNDGRKTATGDSSGYFVIKRAAWAVNFRIGQPSRRYIPRRPCNLSCSYTRKGRTILAP
jgi:hypothetical protein